MACVDENTLVEMVEGRLEPERALGVAAHLDSCPSCRELVAQAVASSLRGGASTRALLAKGDVLGRYAIVEMLGAGAMGVVYAAWDPALLRRVAVKVLRVEPGREGGSDRLLREAQALAQLSHPHVISIHDVGEVDGQVFLAMELIEGDTLGEHLRKEKRAAPEVLRLFCAAGEGLAAAHSKGLVHRDFKPDNVLVGRDGRVRVTDFGLARIAGEPLPAGTAQPSSAETISPLQTRSGLLLGTPAYMSPEQMAGKPADARSDQFSFCVALFEALAGARPFAVNQLPALKEAIDRGEIRRGGLPKRIERVLRRGLASDPAARHPSMDALLRELRRPPLITAPRIALALLLLAAGFLFLHSRQTCVGAEAAFGELWSPSQREAAREAFNKSDPISGSFAFAAADAAFSSLREQWLAMRTDACLATRVRGEQSEQLLDLRMECLDDRRREASALADLFVQATPKTVARARDAVAALSPLSRCADARALSTRAALPADPAARKTLEEAKEQVARAKAFNDSGLSAQALAAAQNARAAAEKSGFKPTLADALYQLAEAQTHLSAFKRDEAVSTLHASAAAAIEGEDDAAAATAFTQLIHLRGFFRFDPEEGEMWGRYAYASVKRMGGDDLLEGGIERRLSTLYINGPPNAAHAFEHIAKARALLLRAHAPEAKLSMVDSGEATVDLNIGKVDEAIRLYRIIVERDARLAGPENSNDSFGLGNLGQALIYGGKLEEAVTILRHALALDRKSGASPAFSESRLAAALRKLGQLEEAEQLDREAIDFFERSQGDPHWEFEALLGLGDDLLARGEPVQARAPFEKANQICCSGGAELDDNGARAKLGLARALAKLEPARSEKLAQESAAILKPLAEKYGSYYRTLFDESEAFLASGRH